MARPTRWILPALLTLGSAVSLAAAAPRKAGGNPVPAAKRAASAERGRKLYAAQCASCHGAEGRGDGEDGMYYTPLPTNFRTDAFAQQADTAVFQGIRAGKGNMPGFQQKLSEAETWDVVNYLRTLAPAPAK